MSWLKRIFTLPKAKNSVSDVLGDDYAALFRALAAPMVDEIVDQVAGETVVLGTGTFLFLAEKTANALAVQWWRVTGKELSQAEYARVRETLRKTILHFEGETREDLVETVRQAIYKALKL